MWVPPWGSRPGSAACSCGAAGTCGQAPPAFALIASARLVSSSLVQPGLSAIVTAIIGSRKIFQRMTTYSRYTVAMTFRICFTFGLITVIYDW